MIQILFGIWLCLLKQNCREFYGDQFFFLLQPLKSFVKASKVSFKLFGEKKLKKKKRGRRCWADPPPFRPSEAVWPSFPSTLSRARAPDSLHPAPATWRPYAGVVDAPRPTGLPRSGWQPAPQRAIMSPRFSLFFLPVRSAAPAVAALCRAPLAPKPSSQLRSRALD